MWKEGSIGLAFGAVLLLTTPVNATTQHSVGQDVGTQARYLAVNALLGGSVAGLAALLRDDPVVPSFARGAGGGAIAFAGKRTAAQEGFGRGILGRQITSVGSSITGNAVAGRGSLDRLALSVGPARGYFGRDVEGVHLRLDVLALAAVAWFAVDGGRIDVHESLSFGTVVFHGNESRGFPGTISHRPHSMYPPREVLAHEQVHVLQLDQSFLSLGRPLEDWAANRFPRLGSVLDRLEFNLPVLAATVGAATWIWDYPEYPWEWEAELLQSAGAGR